MWFCQNDKLVTVTHKKSSLHSLLLCSMIIIPNSLFKKMCQCVFAFADEMSLSVLQSCLNEAVASPPPVRGGESFSSEGKC